jgi:hypothetical protein
MYRETKFNKIIFISYLDLEYYLLVDILFLSASQKTVEVEQWRLCNRDK